MTVVGVIVAETSPNNADALPRDNVARVRAHKAYIPPHAEKTTEGSASASDTGTVAAQGPPQGAQQPEVPIVAQFAVRTARAANVAADTHDDNGGELAAAAARQVTLGRLLGRQAARIGGKTQATAPSVEDDAVAKPDPSTEPGTAGRPPVPEIPFAKAAASLAAGNQGTLTAGGHAADGSPVPDSTAQESEAVVVAATVASPAAAAATLRQVSPADSESSPVEADPETSTVESASSPSAQVDGEKPTLGPEFTAKPVPGVVSGLIESFMVTIGGQTKPEENEEPAEQETGLSPRQELEEEQKNRDEDKNKEEAGEEAEAEEAAAKISAGESEQASPEGGLATAVAGGDLEIVKDDIAGLDVAADAADANVGDMVNYAKSGAGAVVLRANDESQNKASLLSDSRDSYFMSPCAANKFFDVQLSDDITVTDVVISNFERFASAVKDFRLLGSQSYPSNHWIVLGNFTAEDRHGEQSFGVSPTTRMAMVRYLRFRWLSQHRSEYYCTLTGIKVHGHNAIQSLSRELHRRSLDNYTDDEDDDERGQAPLAAESDPLLAASPPAQEAAEAVADPDSLDVPPILSGQPPIADAAEPPTNAEEQPEPSPVKVASEPAEAIQQLQPDAPVLSAPPDHNHQDDEEHLADDLRSPDTPVAALSVDAAAAGEETVGVLEADVFQVPCVEDEPEMPPSADTARQADGAESVSQATTEDEHSESGMPIGNESASAGTNEPSDHMGSPVLSGAEPTAEAQASEDALAVAGDVAAEGNRTSCGTNSTAIVLPQAPLKTSSASDAAATCGGGETLSPSPELSIALPQSLGTDSMVKEPETADETPNTEQPGHADDRTEPKPAWPENQAAAPGDEAVQTHKPATQPPPEAGGAASTAPAAPLSHQQLADAVLLADSAVAPANAAVPPVTRLAFKPRRDNSTDLTARHLPMCLLPSTWRLVQPTSPLVVQDAHDSAPKPTSAAVAVSAPPSAASITASPAAPRSQADLDAVASPSSSVVPSQAEEPADEAEDPSRPSRLGEIGSTCAESTPLPLPDSPDFAAAVLAAVEIAGTPLVETLPEIDAVPANFNLTKQPAKHAQVGQNTWQVLLDHIEGIGKARGKDARRLYAFARSLQMQTNNVVKRLGTATLEAIKVSNMSSSAQQHLQKRVDEVATAVNQSLHQIAAAGVSMAWTSSLCEPETMEQLQRWAPVAVVVAGTLVLVVLGQCCLTCALRSQVAALSMQLRAIDKPSWVRAKLRAATVLRATGRLLEKDEDAVSPTTIPTAHRF